MMSNKFLQNDKFVKLIPNALKIILCFTQNKVLIDILRAILFNFQAEKRNLKFYFFIR